MHKRFYINRTHDRGCHYRYFGGNCDSSVSQLYCYFIWFTSERWIDAVIGKVQACIQTGVGCEDLNTTKELAAAKYQNRLSVVAPADGQVAEATSATLKWKNEGCIVQVAAAADGGIAYKFNFITGKATAAQCAKGAGLDAAADLDGALN